MRLGIGSSVSKERNAGGWKVGEGGLEGALARAQRN